VEALLTYLHIRRADIEEASAELKELVIKMVNA